MKWSSSPRWVSNSPNPTGQHGGVCLAAAPHRPAFPSPAASSRSLSTPLCLSKLPPVSVYPSRHTFQKSGKKLMRLCWHYSSPPSLCVSVTLGRIYCIHVHRPFYLKKKKNAKRKTAVGGQAVTGFGKGNSEVDFQERKAGFPPH